uniref:Putative salivary kunitz domain protein n=1 Tax=Ixodes ricinus TaxID=34613 RepID=A0A0K8R7R3_IXORI
MLIRILWILAIARTCTCSTSCQSAVEVDLCSLDPDISHDSNSFEGFFYDRKTDQCLSAKLGYSKSDGSVENKFTNADFCNSRCRKNVSELCFDDATDYRFRFPKPAVEKWTYNSDATKCVRFMWEGADMREKNVFDSPTECVNRCKVPDLGLCAFRFRTECKHGDDLYIWYDNTTQECKILPPHHCPTRGNGFYTFRECYQRCGRFVEDKCKLPIQNMSFCSEVQTRYGYNTKTLRCESFQGCEDSGNSFPTAKACWNTCASKSRHRCVQEPDYTLSGAVLRYYYDITHNKCESKRVFRGHVSGNSNLFKTLEDCKETCMATYNYEPDWL